MENAHDNDILDADSDFDTAAVTDRHRRLRSMLMTLLVFCGLMIVLVVLSQIRAGARSETSGGFLTETLAQTEHVEDSGVSVAVTAMPTNRIPVRRAGLPGSN